MKLTFKDLAIKVLQEARRPLSVDEIWDYAKQKGYDQDLSSAGKTPVATIGALIYISIRDDKPSVFGKTGYRPTRFYYKPIEKEIQLEEKAKPVREAKRQVANSELTKKFTFIEKDLHPFLSYFAFNFLHLYTKTINHSKSKRDEFGEWIHPDMLGCYFPLADWEDEVFELSSKIGNVSIKIFSFEIKRELNLSNLREAFFQSVSNSSWANEGYLVASEISNNDEFKYELKRLSTSFGIGVIRLDIKDPDSSEIILPSRFRDTLDWEAMNKLAINPDFKDFLKRIKNDLSNKEVIKEKYDKILDKDTLVSSIKVE